jgi:hypothetical protein
MVLLVPLLEDSWLCEQENHLQWHLLVNPINAGMHVVNLTTSTLRGLLGSVGEEQPNDLESWRLRI